ncbi:MAG: YlmC/YmxH family sporulation protein [Peptococcaceae bacterium]|nr:YlmC/YmxH family sporulation protein [Peptococcaceae bacterium]
MLLSELAGKEIINLEDGAKLGTVGDTDLVIVPESGVIESLILPERGMRSWWGGGEKDYIAIPWQAVKKIGNEVIIVDMSEKRGKSYTI